MRFAILSSLLAVLAVSSVVAFAPAASFTRGCSVTGSQLFSSEPEDEEGLDLNLEEMFDMYVRYLTRISCMLSHAKASLILLSRFFISLFSGSMPPIKRKTLKKLSRK